MCNLDSDCYCNSCNSQIGGARVVCLGCLSLDSEARTVNFCDDQACWGSSLVCDQHLPTHDILKVRTVLHLRDIPNISELAENALSVARECFTTSTSSVEEASDIQGDATGKLLHVGLCSVHHIAHHRCFYFSQYQRPKMLKSSQRFWKLWSSVTFVKLRFRNHAGSVSIASLLVRPLALSFPPFV